MRSSKTWQTSDLPLAAALFSLGHIPNDLNRENPRRVAFIYDYSENIAKAEELYWKDMLSVNPRTYAEALKGLKNRLYSESR